MEYILSLLSIFLLSVCIYLYYYLKTVTSYKDIKDYAKILESAPFPTVICDASDNTILMINKRASQMLGIKAQEPVKNKSFDFFVDSEKRGELVNSLRAQGNNADIEVNIRSVYGRDFWTLLSANLISLEKRPAIFMAFTDITLQKELEIATQKNKELYKSIIRTSPDAIIMVDMLGKIYMVSPAAFKLFDYSITDHYPYGMQFLDLIHPEDRGRAKHDLRQIKAKINTGPNEYQALKRDGSIICIESHAEVIWDQNERPDSILYIIRDITKRKEAERIIRENEERFTTIFQEVPDPLLIVTSDGKIIDLNRRCEEWFSIDKNDYIGCPLQDCGFIQSGESNHNIIDLILLLHPGEKFETQILLPDETRRYTILSARTISIGGSPAILFLMNDIDEIQRAYKALTLANSQLNLLNSITRHDILNKVMVINGYSEILREELAGEDLLNMLTNIYQAGIDVKNLIEFTKEYQDLGVAQPKWQSIYHIMNKQVIKSISSGITLILPDTQLEIYADPMLEKVLYNLVENSKRHGGIVNQVFLSFNQIGDEGLLMYMDNGLGIAESEKELIFKKGHGKNTGLGLFIIREILSITGLSIRECGVQGKGVKFEIRVPAGKYRINQVDTK